MALSKLSDDLHAIKGRVSLVKNVYATRATLQAMYGESAGRFFELKLLLDPDGLLCNDFLDRTFGGLYEDTYGWPIETEARREGVAA